MSARVIFIDTSILLNLIPVPGKDKDRAAVIQGLQDRKAAELILPITTVIETGNHIAQLKDGQERRTAAQRFQLILEAICEHKAPWVLNDVKWDREFLRQFLNGGGTQTPYLDHAVNELGAGDLCILTECAEYRARTRLSAEIWTLDHSLAAHS